MEFNEIVGVLTQQDTHYTQVFEQDEVLSFILLPDCQIPLHDEHAVASVTKYIKYKNPDILVQVGDLVDLTALGRFTKGKPGTTEMMRISDDCAKARDILKDWRDGAPDADMFVLFGNHERRYWDLLEEMPHLEGMLKTLEEMLSFEEMNITPVYCYPYGEAMHIGKLLVTHGNYTGMNASRKHADEFGMSVAHGHNHRLTIQSKNHFFEDHVRSGYSLGTLSKRRMDFFQGRPMPHQNGFGVGHVLPDGRFFLTLVPIIAGEFVSPEGKLFSWRD